MGFRTYRSKKTIIADTWWKAGDVPQAKIQPYGNGETEEGMIRTPYGSHRVRPGDLIVKEPDTENGTVKYYPVPAQNWELIESHDQENWSKELPEGI